MNLCELKAATIGGTAPEIVSKIGYLTKPSSGRVVVDYSGKQRSTIEIVQREIHPVDARPLANGLRLEKDGVELTRFRNSVAERIRSDPDFDGDALVAAFEDYHEVMVPFVKERSGGRDVIPLRNGLILRRQTPQNLSDRKREERVASPYAHIDFTQKSAQDYTLIAMAWENVHEVAPYSRFAIVQSWHTLTPPPQDFPLVFCHSESLTTEDLFHIDYFPPPKRVDIMAEVHAVAYNPEHLWFYFSNMDPDEVVLFKGYDSAADGNRQIFPHTSFRDPSVSTETPTRESIEARYVVYFD